MRILRATKITLLVVALMVSASTALAGEFSAVVNGRSIHLGSREDVDDGRPFPGILPSLTVGNRYLGLNLTYLPKQAVEKFTATRMQDQSTSGIIFLQFKFSMNP